MSLRNINDLMREAIEKYLVSEPGPPPGPTYDEFVAHITALATDGERAWDGNVIATLGNKVHTTTAGAETGTMAGTPWGPVDLYGGSFHNGTVCRIVQHAMPDYVAFQSLGTTKLLCRLVDTGITGGVNTATRNNFTSSSSATSTRRWRMSELIYWDGTRAQRMQPSLGLGPEPYTW